MSQKLTDKIVIITGAAQGIGLATAELFCAQGAKVALVDVDAGLVTAAAAKLAETGAQAVGYQADVRKAEDCAAVAEAVTKRFGRIDALVNNAGIARDNLLMRLSEADWDMVMDVNLKGAFLFTKAVVRPMLKARSGAIVNVASIVGQQGNGGQVNYAASKGGLVSLTKSCAREFASRGIRVNAVSPGFIRTRLTDVVPEQAKEAFISRIPLNRIGEPLDVARAIVFLCGEQSSYITGQVLSVNGGSRM